jgi:hypothetical protein
MTTMDKSLYPGAALCTSKCKSSGIGDLARKTSRGLILLP